MPNSTIKLWSARACPFAHRTRLALAEKGLDFELIEIDLQNKPASFSEVSVYGKVPALEHQGQRFVESAIVNEYLEEVFPSPRLLPTDPAQRALARFWIDYANTRFVPAWGKLLRASDANVAAEAATELREALATLERGLAQGSGAGPYWFGAAQPGLVDLSLYPWFERWPALEHYRGIAVPPSAERLLAWRKALSERPSVRAIENQTSFYVERFARYAGRVAVPAATPDPRGRAEAPSLV
jgi:glutathione S-transferase